MEGSGAIFSTVKAPANTASRRACFITIRLRSRTFVMTPDSIGGPGPVGIKRRRKLSTAPITILTSWQARLLIDQPARVAGVRTYRLKEKFPAERGAFVVPLQNKVSLIDLVD